jgi:hypothetical protein
MMFGDYWLFHLTNGFFAAWQWLLLGQGLLWFLLPPRHRHENPIYKTFLWLLTPVYVLTRRLTPAFVQAGHLGLVAFFYLFVLRIMVFFTFAYFDAVPSPSP